MQLVRMNIVATRDLDDRTLSHQAFLNDPQLLSRCPPPAPPGRKVPSQSSRLPINLQINGQTCHLNSQSDRWPSPDAYKETYHAKAGMHAITSFPPPAFRASGPGGSELV